MKLRYVRLASGQHLPPLERFSPYKAVVIIDDFVERDWQQAVSRWLAETGCLYMCAWGRDCSSWDDSVDRANLEQFGFGEVPDDRFIMTTWHSDESLSEMMWFAKFVANHPDIELERVLILHVGSTDREEEISALYHNAQISNSP